MKKIITFLIIFLFTILIINCQTENKDITPSEGEIINKYISGEINSESPIITDENKIILKGVKYDSLEDVMSDRNLSEEEKERVNSLYHTYIKSKENGDFDSIINKAKEMAEKGEKKATIHYE
jgi:hypothetical protein